jgi:predicted MFS family arabinose efflux permease
VNGISSRMVTLFAVAAGLAVANIYYPQPLLTAIADSFDVGSGSASLIVSVGTVCYAAGLALLVPLGDVVDRRRLIVVLLGVVAVCQVIAACAPSLAVLLAATALLSVTAVIGPLLVAFAASLAAVEQRGAVTGRVLGGILIGILLARTGGGLIAEWGGWRTVYAVAAVITVILAVIMWYSLPQVPVAATMRYSALLRSVISIVREEPTVRLRCAFGFFTFAGFNALWTSLAFLLARPPYSWSEAEIGLVGLLGAVGAYAAGVAGRLVDRGGERRASGLLLFAVLVSWGLMALGRGTWPAALLLGVVLLDLGVQGMQTTNLAVQYRIRPSARSRVTTAYMTIYFLGGFAGSSASAVAYSAAGWNGVCLVGAGCAGAALVLWLSTARMTNCTSSAPPTAVAKATAGPTGTTRTATRKQNTANPINPRSTPLSRAIVALRPL